MKSLIDQYIEFDIFGNNYKYGIIQDIKDDKVYIQQIGVYYNNKHYVENCIKVRDIIYDGQHRWLKVGV